MQSFENCVTCSLLTLNHPTVIHWWYTLFICSSAICRWFSPTHAWPHTWGSSSCRNTVVLTSLAYREREKVFKHHTKKERSQLTQYWEYPVPSLGIVGSDFKGNCQAEQMWKTKGEDVERLPSTFGTQFLHFLLFSQLTGIPKCMYINTPGDLYSLPIRLDVSAGSNVVLCGQDKLIVQHPFWLVV